MGDPYSWELELFGSSPNQTSLDRGADNSENSITHSGSMELGGDDFNGVEVSSGGVEAVISSSALNIDEVTFLEVGPLSGMIYLDLQSLYTAYQAHANHKGFSVMKRTSRKVLPDEYKYTVFVCDRARISTTKKYSKKVGCQARVNAIRMEDGSWRVGKTFSDHNHELCPNMSILMPAHRSITINMKRQLEANDIAGIRVCKNVRLAEVEAGGPLNLGYMPKDCRNYVDARRRLRLGVGDAEAIRKLFVRLQHKERDFFYLMDIGENGRLRNVLWIYPQSKAAYEDFHDVVSFGTTYLVNRYKMPFATIVGVNHHGQSILLGCALVTHKDADSFRWLFANWLEAMSGIAPTCIITDQCESIRIAIRELMPNTIHRYCLWHILCKMPVKFKGLTNYHSAAKEFKELVYESLNIECFERHWVEFVVKHGLDSNEWLRSLYEERESWVPVYLNHIFWAGMMSTQRSEGMHAYFDGYINSRCTLKQIVEQYEIATVDKIHKEFVADFDCKSKVIRCITHFPWEKQYRDAYTNNIFKKVQQDINQMFYCLTIEEITHSSDDDPLIKKLKVTESVFVEGHYVRESTYMVTHWLVGEYYECNCRSFEFKGILYCHILKAMCRENVQVVNLRYLLRRWMKDVYRRHSSIFFARGYPHMTAEYKKFQEVERVYQQCTDAAICSLGKMEFIKQCCYTLIGELSNWNPTTDVPNVSTPGRTTYNDLVGGTLVLNPDVARPVGRPRGNRFPSGFERNRGRRGARGRRGKGGLRGGRAASDQGSNHINLNGPAVGTEYSFAV